MANDKSKSATPAAGSGGTADALVARRKEEQAASLIESPAPASPPTSKNRFRLIDQDLLHDGVRYEPGEELPLFEDELIRLGLTHLVAPIG